MSLPSSWLLWPSSSGRGAYPEKRLAVSWSLVGTSPLAGAPAPDPDAPGTCVCVVSISQGDTLRFAAGGAAAKTVAAHSKQASVRIAMEARGNPASPKGGPVNQCTKAASRVPGPPLICSGKACECSSASRGTREAKQFWAELEQTQDQLDCQPPPSAQVPHVWRSCSHGTAIASSRAPPLSHTNQPSVQSRSEPSNRVGALPFCARVQNQRRAAPNQAINSTQDHS